MWVPVGEFVTEVDRLVLRITLLTAHSYDSDDADVSLWALKSTEIHEAATMQEIVDALDPYKVWSTEELVDVEQRHLIGIG